MCTAEVGPGAECWVYCQRRVLNHISHFVRDGGDHRSACHLIFDRADGSGGGCLSLSHSFALL